jgi:hypothetical protein
MSNDWFLGSLLRCCFMFLFNWKYGEVLQSLRIYPAQQTSHTALLLDISLWVHTCGTQRPMPYKTHENSSHFTFRLVTVETTKDGAHLLDSPLFALGHFTAQVSCSCVTVCCLEIPIARDLLHVRYEGEGGSNEPELGCCSLMSGRLECLQDLSGFHT